MSIVEELQSELDVHVDKRYKETFMRFYKEPIKFRGVRTDVVRKIARTYYRHIRSQTTNNLLKLCEELLESRYNEDFLVAIQWASERKEEYTEEDFSTFEKWIEKYVTDWGKVDWFCLGLLNYLAGKFPAIAGRAKDWTKSENRWFRRAAAVIFIGSGSKTWTTHKHNLKDIFDVSLKLMDDKDDLVQKGYGWALKAAAEAHQKEVFDFVMKHKREMPRTALRYAIEKMPQNMKERAMAKDWV